MIFLGVKSLRLIEIYIHSTDFSSDGFDFGQSFAKSSQPVSQGAPTLPLHRTPSNAPVEEIDQSALDELLVKYKGVFQFDAQNEDELSIKPGDIVMVGVWM